MTNAVPETVTNQIVVVTNWVTRDVSGMDVVDKVNDLYSSMFQHFLVMISLIAGIVGVIIPILLQRFQRQEGRLQEERLNADFRNQMIAAKNEFDTKFKRISDEQNKIEATLNNAQDEIKKKLAKAHAFTAYIDAYNQHRQNNHEQAVRAAIFAAKEYISADDEKPLIAVLEIVINSMAHLNMQRIEQENLADRFDQLDSSLREVVATDALKKNIDLYFEARRALKSRK